MARRRVCGQNAARREDLAEGQPQPRVAAAGGGVGAVTRHDGRRPIDEAQGGLPGLLRRREHGDAVDAPQVGDEHGCQQAEEEHVQQQPSQRRSCKAIDHRYQMALA